MNQDQEQLKLLSIFHYIVGGIIVLFSCFPVLHVIFGIVMILAPGKMQSNGSPPPAVLGWMFALVGGAFMLVGWGIGGCVIAAGRFLAGHRRYMFCLVVAGIECLFMPFGTVLGVFTIIVLMRESVKSLFGAGSPSPA